MVLVGGLLQGCTSDDNKDLEYSIRDLPLIGGTQSTDALRTAIGATWLGWGFTIESDGTVVPNIDENLTTILDWKTPVTNAPTALISLAGNGVGLVILDVKPDQDPADTNQTDWKKFQATYSNVPLTQKVIGHTTSGSEVVAYIRTSSSDLTESYKIYTWLSTPAGQAVVKQLGYTAL